MKYLDELMDTYHYTEKTIAQEINVTVPTVYNWRNGNNQISHNNMLKLKRLLKKVKERRNKNPREKETQQTGYNTGEAAEILGIERRHVNSLIIYCLPDDYELKKINVSETGNYVFELTMDDIELLAKAIELKKQMGNKEVQKEISKMLKSPSQKEISKMPKNPNQKVLIPSYVARMIEKSKKEGGSILNFGSEVSHQNKAGSELGMKTYRWMTTYRTEKEIEEAKNKIARAWLDGYEIEEQEYVIVLAEQYSMEQDRVGIWSCYVELTSHFENRKKLEYKGIDNCYVDPIKSKIVKFKRENHPVTKSAVAQYIKYKFTEEEIKDLDERYWAFAEPIIDW